jgi:hypothetical protein
LKTDAGTVGLFAYNGGYGGNDQIMVAAFVMSPGKLSGS